MKAHQEWIPTVAWPGRRLMAAVAQHGRRSTAVPRAPRGGLVGRGPRMVVAVSKESRNGGGGVKEGSRRRRQRGPDGSGMRGKRKFAK
jgi:hypothetical protein